MQKGEADVKRQKMLRRLDVDPEALEVIDSIADEHAPSRERFRAMILESWRRKFALDPQAAMKELDKPQLAAVA